MVVALGVAAWLVLAVLTTQGLEGLLFGVGRVDGVALPCGSELLCLPMESAAIFARARLRRCNGRPLWRA